MKKNTLRIYENYGYKEYQIGETYFTRDKLMLRFGINGNYLPFFIGFPIYLFVKIIAIFLPFKDDGEFLRRVSNNFDINKIKHAEEMVRMIKIKELEK